MKARTKNHQATAQIWWLRVDSDQPVGRVKTPPSTRMTQSNPYTIRAANVA